MGIHSFEVDDQGDLGVAPGLADAPTSGRWDWRGTPGPDPVVPSLSDGLGPADRRETIGGAVLPFVWGALRDFCLGGSARAIPDRRDRDRAQRSGRAPDACARPAVRRQLRERCGGAGVAGVRRTPLGSESVVALPPQSCYQPRLHGTRGRTPGRQPDQTFAPRTANMA